jgi:hypothetical protein
VKGTQTFEILRPPPTPDFFATVNSARRALAAAL